MHSAVHKTNSRKFLVLGILVAAAAIAYLFVDVSFSNERLFRYAMKIRIPKLMVMLVASAAIGGATIVCIVDRNGFDFVFRKHSEYVYKDHGSQ